MVQIRSVTADILLTSSLCEWWCVVKFKSILTNGFVEVLTIVERTLKLFFCKIFILSQSYMVTFPLLHTSPSPSAASYAIYFRPDALIFINYHIIFSFFTTCKPFLLITILFTLTKSNFLDPYDLWSSPETYMGLTLFLKSSHKMDYLNSSVLFHHNAPLDV